MGFSMELVTLFPEHCTVLSPKSTGLDKEFTLWRAKHIIPGEVHWRPPHIEEENPTPSTNRADNCMMTWLLENLLARLKKFDENNFAPPFVSFACDNQSNPFRQEIEWKKKKLCFDSLTGGEQFVMPLWKNERGAGFWFSFPNASDIKEHNEAIRLSDKQFEQYLKNVGHWHIPIRSYPFVWASCETVANWLLSLEVHSSSVCATELHKDPVSLAIVRARRAYLAEIGKVGTKILFSFNSIAPDMRI